MMLVVAIVGGVVGAFAMQYLDIGTPAEHRLSGATGGVDVALKQREQPFQIVVAGISQIGRFGYNCRQ
jgi:hypothetical protein